MFCFCLTPATLRVTVSFMIKSFKHKGLKQLFEKGKSSAVKQDHIKKLRLILTFLNEAHLIQDIDFPGSDLHRLKGKLKEVWSLKVSGNWRVTFRYSDGNVYEVDYIDYH